MRKKKVIAKPPCGEKEDPIILYRLYRDYIEHENSLINNRVSWFIQLHSFLIASYGIVFAALISTFFSRDKAMIPPLGPQILASLLLVGIAAIGLESSEAAKRSIIAADRAIQALQRRWCTLFKQSGGGDILPHIIGGHPVPPEKAVQPDDSVAGAKKDVTTPAEGNVSPGIAARVRRFAKTVKGSIGTVIRGRAGEEIDDGAKFHLRMPSALRRLWLVSFVVPIVFTILAFSEETWNATSNDTKAVGNMTVEHL